MKKLLLLLLVFPFTSIGQSFHQYFDSDTNFNTIPVIIDTPINSNVWQIGPPQKTIFNDAASTPNVIVTDTLNYYPNNDTSSFIIKVSTEWSWGVLALQWMQKLDIDSIYDGGIIEFSVDTGQTWQNVFNNPYVYNFYGFQTQNADTLLDGTDVFSGKDTTWRNIWLCYDMSWGSVVTDTMYFKFTFVSDGINNNREGWMMDNFFCHTTQVHTVKEHENDNEISIYPNPSDGNINIEVKRKNEFQIIESLEVYSTSGRLVKSFENIPIKYFINLKDLPSGSYIVKVKSTNYYSEKNIVLK